MGLGGAIMYWFIIMEAALVAMERFFRHAKMKRLRVVNAGMDDVASSPDKR